MIPVLKPRSVLDAAAPWSRSSQFHQLLIRVRQLLVRPNEAKCAEHRAPTARLTEVDPSPLRGGIGASLVQPGGWLVQITKIRGTSSASDSENSFGCDYCITIYIYTQKSRC